MFKPKSESAPAPADAVRQARTRARHRFIGALVLLAIGIIGFPLVFETQPRPIPIDIAIEIPRKDSLPALTAPSSPLSAAHKASAASAATPPVLARTAPRTTTADPVRPAETIITESRSDAGRELAPPAPRASASERAASRAMATAASAARPALAEAGQQAAAASASASAPLAARPGSDGERARALLEGRPVAAAEAQQRFVVQVGAFADAEAARETRLKVEKLGLKTYTQVAQTADGSRIRVRAGPFSSRAEADAALARTRAAGLAAVVLTL